MLPKNWLCIIFLAGILLTGCQLLAPYQGPVTPTPPHWKESVDFSAEETEQSPIPQTGKEASFVLQEEEFPEPCFEDVCRDLGNWWEVFQDPILNELEEQALHSSYTLWAALERVIEARAIARVNFAPLLPNINFTPSFNRTGSLMQNPLSGVIGGQNQPTGTVFLNMQIAWWKWMMAESQEFIPFPINKVALILFKDI